VKNTRIYIIICLLVLFQYGNTFEHDYAWDDAIVITQNDRVQQGLSEPSSFFRNIKGDEVQYRYGYRPISLLSYATDIEISGMTPKTGHLMNVLYFALVCCLIFYFLRRMFPEKNMLFSAIIVGLFLIHPIHTEVVANIKSRDEILAMIFGLLSMIFFLNFIENSKRKWLNAVAMAIALVFSFLSKENGITFVAVLVLIAYMRQTDRVVRILNYALPVLAGALLIAIRMYVYSDRFFENNATELLENFQYTEDGFLGNPLHAASGIFHIIPNVLNILLKDLGLMLFPVTLVHDYGFAHSNLVSWSHPMVILSVIVHLVLLYFMIREFKKKSVLLFGMLFYIFTLSVYLHVFQVGPDYMAERFLFIPSLGFLIAIVAGIETVTKASFDSTAEPIWKNKRAKIILSLIVVFGLLGFGKTINRNKAWENNRVLFETDIANLDDCSRAHYNYACVLHDDYYKAPSPDKIERILYHYQKAILISDRSMKAMLDLGSAYMEFGKPKKGKAVFEAAVEAHHGIAAPLMQLAKYYMSQNQYQSALVQYEKAGEFSKISEINHGKAICLFKLNRIDEAIKALEKGRDYNPENPEYYELLSDLYFFIGEKNKALKALDEAMKLSPNNISLLKKRQLIARNGDS
jgi:protein O-mannosyl-transferase